ncbi:DUF3054 domain-containing protein [Haloferacaceae archaeon DSL9]
MNAIPAVLDGRLDSAALPLAVGDLLVIVGVLVIGMYQHQTLGDPGHVAGVLAPFLIGWILIAPLIGAYSPGAAESAKAAVPLAIRSWVPASIVGFALRWTEIFPGGLEITFVAITFFLIAILLGVWRSLLFKVR